MTLKHFYPASEQRFYECLVCQEAIYNPLCQNCLNKQINVWLSSYPNLAKNLKPKLKKFLQAVNNEAGREESLICAACKNKKAAVCPYCFTEFVLGQLKKLKANRHILREFIMLFNFDYDGMGYTSNEQLNETEVF